MLSSLEWSRLFSMPESRRNAAVYFGFGTAPDAPALRAARTSDNGLLGRAGLSIDEFGQVSIDYIDNGSVGEQQNSSAAFTLSGLRPRACTIIEL